MPYKTGKLKGELLVSEIRKLVRLHNKLSKIKIPPRSSRDDIIKIVEDNGYKIDHKNQKLTATRMNKDLTLKEAQETFPVKPRAKKEPPKPAEKPKKEDEVRPAKKAFPPIPKNIRGKRVNVQFGKPPTKERIETGKINLGKLQAPKPKVEALKVVKGKKKTIELEPTIKTIKIKKEEPKKKKPTANISLFLGIMNATASGIKDGKIKTQKEIFEDLGTGMNTFEKMTKTYNEIKQTQKGEKLEKLNKSYMTIKNFIEKPKKEEPKKAEPKKEEPKKAEPKKEGINKFLTMNLEQIKKEIQKGKERGESGYKITGKMDLPTKERNEKGDKPTLERVKKDFEKLTRWCAFNDEIFQGIKKRLSEFLKDGTITREEYNKLNIENNKLDTMTGGICSILDRYRGGLESPYSLPREFYVKMREAGQEERAKLLTTAKKEEPKKEQPTTKADIKPQTKKFIEKLKREEDQYGILNSLKTMNRKELEEQADFLGVSDDFASDDELRKKIKDEIKRVQAGTAILCSSEIKRLLNDLRDILLGNEKYAEIAKGYGKEKLKYADYRKKFIDGANEILKNHKKYKRECTEGQLTEIRKGLKIMEDSPNVQKFNKRTPTKAEPKKAEPKKAEPKKTTVNFDEIEEGLEEMDDEINMMTANIRGSSKYSLKKANFTEKEIFSESKFKNMKDLESQFKILKDKASNVTDDDQKQVARNLIENITDRLPFVKDNIK